MSISPKTLDDVCEFIVDCLHSTAPKVESGFPLIRTPNVGKGRLDLNGVHQVSQATYEHWTRRAIPQSGDLILAREAPAGNVAIIKSGQTVCLGQRTVHLRPDPNQVDPDFLCYFLLAPLQQGKLLAGETGATAKHVNMKDIRALNLGELPKLKTQREAGSILATYDDLIETNQRRIALLEESARQLYREWFVRLRFPGHTSTPLHNGVPEGWKRKTLGEITTLTYGKALKKEKRVPGKFFVFGSSGIVGTHESALCEGPGIIVGRKGNVGSVFWCPSGFYPIDTVYFVEPREADLFLYYALSHTSFLSTDVAVPGLNREYAYSREILLPSPDLKKLFVDAISPVHEQLTTLKKSIQVLTTASDHLLPRLMSPGFE